MPHAFLYHNLYIHCPRSHPGRDRSTMMGPVTALNSCMKPNVYTQAPDGGWGWVVAAAFFFVEVFSYGIIKIFGIFLQDLTNQFEETNSRVSWIVSICVFVMSFTGETQLPRSIGDQVLGKRWLRICFRKK